MNKENNPLLNNQNLKITAPKRQEMAQNKPAVATTIPVESQSPEPIKL